MNITEKLLSINSYSRPGEKLQSVKQIVVHWVGNSGSSAIANRNYFENCKNTKTYASSQYIIGLGGEIIRCIPESEVAYHAGNSTVNRNSIGIENCHPDWTGKFNSATYNSLVELCVDLCKRYNLSANNIIRHYDVTKKECPKFYVKNPSAWNQFRQDVANRLNNIVDNTYRDIFDSDLYNLLYIDLQKAYKNNAEELYNHFIGCGANEGRIASFVFDIDYYLNKYDDIRQAYSNKKKEALLHFLTHGINECRVASKFFDINVYYEVNKDVKEVFKNDNKKAMLHFIRNGMREGRVASNEFNVRNYRNNYIDLQNEFKDDWKQYFKHYVVWGQNEGRVCV